MYMDGQSAELQPTCERNTSVNRRVPRGPPMGPPGAARPRRGLRQTCPDSGGGKVLYRLVPAGRNTQKSDPQTDSPTQSGFFVSACYCVNPGPPWLGCATPGTPWPGCTDGATPCAPGSPQLGIVAWVPPWPHRWPHATPKCAAAPAPTPRTCSLAPTATPHLGSRPAEPQAGGGGEDGRCGATGQGCAGQAVRASGACGAKPRAPKLPRLLPMEAETGRRSVTPPLGTDPPFGRGGCGFPPELPLPSRRSSRRSSRR